MHRDPAGDSLAQLQVELIYQISVRILRSAQHQLLALEDVNKAGIAHRNRGDKFNHPFEHSMKGIRGRHAAADLMQKLDIQYFLGPGAFFAHYPTSHIWLRRRKICAILQLLSCASTVTLSSFPSLRSVPQGLRVVASLCRNVI